MKKLMVMIIMVALLITYSSVHIYKNDSILHDDVIILRLAENYHDDYPTNAGIDKFIEMVSNKSNGRIDIRIYDNYKLGSDIDVIEQLQYGGIDFACVNTAILSERCKEVKQLLAPNIFNKDTYNEFLYSDQSIQLLKYLSHYDLTGLCWYLTSPTIIAVDEIITDDNLNLSKIAVPASQLIIDEVSTMGGAPIPSETKEIYTMFSDGFINGVQEDIISYSLNRYYEYAPYMYETNHVMIPNVLLASRTTMLELSKQDQLLIMNAAQESVNIQNQTLKEKEIESYKILEEKTTKCAFSKDLTDKLYDINIRFTEEDNLIFPYLKETMVNE